MQQVTEDYRSGTVSVGEVAAPGCRAGMVLVQTQASLISAGTEGAALRFGQQSLLRKAMSCPDLARQVVEKIRSQGLRRPTTSCSRGWTFRSPSATAPRERSWRWGRRSRAPRRVIGWPARAAAMPATLRSWRCRRTSSCRFRTISLMRKPLSRPLEPSRCRGFGWPTFVWASGWWWSVWDWSGCSRSSF